MLVKTLVEIIVHALPGRSLLLPKENSLSKPSGGHSSQRVQPQAADKDGIEARVSEHKCAKTNKRMNQIFILRTCQR
jgi:hypothetical protein